jgi:hypothetical protein
VKKITVESAQLLLLLLLPAHAGSWLVLLSC